MPSGVVARLGRTMGLAASLFALAAASGEATPAGTVITNTVTATYNDPGGHGYGTQSNAVTATIAQVGAIAVTPKEPAVDPLAEGYPLGTPITRVFTITNAGNAADAYTIAAAATGAGSITSIGFLTSAGVVPVTVGTTTSPTIPAGGSIRVQLVIATAGTAVGTTFPVMVTARSTNATSANGPVSDQGREWAISQAIASIAGPTGPTTRVTKLVNHVRTHPGAAGETVHYEISFKNYGGSPATNVVLVDNVPPGLTALLPTVSLNGVNAASSATLSGQVLSVKIGTLAAGATDVLTFDATVLTGNIAGASFVNVATLQADGIAQVVTTPASVLIGIANIAYDGYAGANSPVGGAVLTLLDPVTKKPIVLPHVLDGSALTRSPQQMIGVPAAGLPPNNANVNGFTTGADGAYSFVFEQSQLGTAARPAVYDLVIAAPGYRNRNIEVTISPDPSGMLYNAQLRELDQQMLAVPGGFALTANSVSLSNVFGLLGNLPLFAPHPVAVTKTVDRDVASGGDKLVYTVQVGSGGPALGATKVVDTLPAGVVYAPGTSRVDNVAVEPVRAGRTLTWTFANLTASHTITYACVVMPNATENASLVNVVDVDALAGATHVGASATAETRVVPGALGNRIVITGRVFADARRTGHFREGDSGVAGVRIYLEDGSSVQTDKYGRFTFPSVHPGQHVLRVDPTTLPLTVRAYDDRRYDSSRSLVRLVHGVFDAGLMQDVNFALEPLP
ncbi:MAG: hypothetical protein JWN27_1616 [Candidatus Eremiobacteraeota bacterium]|nr:hypothetical protein [Candidatus Eremiobacteraeota bacterium]